MKNKKKICRCPYCGSAAVLRDAKYVYGENAKGRHMYVCARYPECDSYVGAHEHSLKPMGTLADDGLRRKRIETHKVFDRIWKAGIMSKDGAYRRMQYKFGMNANQAHIAQFSEYMCDRLISECERTLKNNKAG